MRILHLGKFYPPAHGGVENYVRDLAVAQVRSGHEVMVLAHGHEKGRATSRESMEGVEVVRAACHGQLVYAPVSPAFPLELRRALKTFRPDVLHAHVPNTSAFFTLLGSMPPMVLHWHSDVVVSEKDRRLAVLYQGYRVFETALLKKARAVVATSGPYLEASAPLARFRDKCRVIPLGVDPARLPEADPHDLERIKARHGEAPVVFSVGRFAYYKGFEYLIRAARDMDAHVVIAGDGPLRPKMRVLVSDLGLDGRVFLPGSVSDGELSAYMDLAQVFCLPSVERTEAFGVVLMEAMSRSTPLVTTRLEGSGVGFVNQDGETGLAVPCEDSGALAAAVSRLLNDPGLARTMGRAGRERFERQFVIDATLPQMDRVYSTIQAPPTAG